MKHREISNLSRLYNKKMMETHMELICLTNWYNLASVWFWMIVCLDQSSIVLSEKFKFLREQSWRSGRKFAVENLNWNFL